MTTDTTTKRELSDMAKIRMFRAALSLCMASIKVNNPNHNIFYAELEKVLKQTEIKQP